MDGDMKRIVVLILCALSINLINAQVPKDSVVKLNLKSIESVVDNQGRKVDSETQALRINRNEYFKSEAKEADSIALSYLQKKSGTYGLSGRKLNIL